LALISVVSVTMRHLWLGVGAPRHVKSRDALASQEERILECQARHGIGGVGEGPAACRITGHEDAVVAGAQMVIDGGVPALQPYPRRLESEVLQRWNPAGGQ